ncbi:MAG TPA: Nif3-like dinuclear metal center hexameric protein [Gemmatimonadales bacterium]|nr:Nif3-like dinuclear metal center hexameric protein [Gemmatimonadales bacterium]
MDETAIPRFTPAPAAAGVAPKDDALPGVALADVVGHLDAYLRIREIPDYQNALNGLEVENAGRIGSIIAAVDASQATIDGAVAAWARARDTQDDPRAAPPLLLVHHGLFWDGNQPVTGRRYRRLRALLANDVALYAAHIPLDIHPEVGNNAVLARRLGVEVEGWFGQYRNLPIGVHGRLQTTREELLSRLDALLDTRATLVPGGPAAVERVGIVTGAASDQLAHARDLGLDTFITGEGPHHTYFDAMEWGVNLVYAGHYATEQVGVQALAEHLGLTFQIPWEFHWHPTGL